MMCAVAAFLLHTERGQQLGQFLGIVSEMDALNKIIEKKAVGEADAGKWTNMALESPLVQQALNVFGGSVNASAAAKALRPKEKTPTTEMGMGSLVQVDYGSVDEKAAAPSDPEACRRNAELKLRAIREASG